MQGSKIVEQNKSAPDVSAQVRDQNCRLVFAHSEGSVGSETAFRIEGSRRLRSADSEVEDYRVASLNSVKQYLRIRAALSGLRTQKSRIRIAGSYLHIQKTQ